MKVKDLKMNSSVDEIVLKLVEKKEPREFTKRYGGTARVCDAIGKDEDGEEVQIALWNDEIDKVEVNETLKITNGWVREWNNKPQVSAGKFGKLEKVE
jgi:ssDNA-binding replication factor A large subunit